MKKLISFLIAISIIVGGYYLYTTYFEKNDEEKIVDCLNCFAQAYGDGDMEICLNCYAPKRRNAITGTNSMISSIVGFNSGIFSNAFSIGVDMFDMEIKFDVKEISFTDETHAKVKANLWESKTNLSPEMTTPLTIDMVKKQSKWYIEDGI